MPVSVSSTSELDQLAGGFFELASEPDDAGSLAANESDGAAEA
jgi:hypothetical protein